jgi:MarR family transcriptional regulator, temperature-dependent positive regulator of motility
MISVPSNFRPANPGPRASPIVANRSAANNGSARSKPGTRSAKANGNGRAAAGARRDSVSPTWLFPELRTFPGHLIRRLQQVAVSIFLDEALAAGCELTPVQFAALVAVHRHPGIDQATLAGVIAHDRTTIVGVLDRLEKKGLLKRMLDPGDRRIRRLVIDPPGLALLQRILPAVQATQQKLLEPLPAADRARFMRLLAKLVDANNDRSRAPMRPVGGRQAAAAAAD